MELDLTNLTVKKIRKMTRKEASDEGWDDYETRSVIEFSDGTLIYASRDEEGNGPGALFGKTKDGKAFSL